MISFDGTTVELRRKRKRGEASEKRPRLGRAQSRHFMVNKWANEVSACTGQAQRGGATDWGGAREKRGQEPHLVPSWRFNCLENITTRDAVEKRELAEENYVMLQQVQVT